MIYIAPAIAAYLAGGFPTGVLVGRLLHNRDIRAEGSGNTGAVNIWRVFGLRWGLLVVAVDIFKGWFAVAMLPRWFGLPDAGATAAFLGLLAMLGHIWSPFLRFHGGKGVATALGVGLGLYPPAALMCMGVWLLVVALTRYASLASLSASLTYPAAVYWQSEPSWGEWSLSLLLPLILTFSHRHNIRRLAAGEELKVGHQGSARQ